MHTFLKLVVCAVMAIQSVTARSGSLAAAHVSSYKYNRLSTNDTAILLIDHQVGLQALVKDFDTVAFQNNVLALASIAKQLKLPVVITASVPEGPNGPLMPEILEMFPDVEVVSRHGEVNAWDNAEFHAAVKKTGRKQLIMAGIVTDVCISFPALSAIEEGYQVFAAVDASGTFNEVVRYAAWDRMSQGGVQLMNWFSILCELSRDWRIHGKVMTDIILKHLPEYKNTAITFNQHHSTN
jgi:nicotinamidase-related amidase